MMTTVSLLTQTQLFDSTHDALLRGDIHVGVTRFLVSLRELRADLPPDDWRSLREQVRNHPVHRLFLQSPFTWRAYTKPRGYAGDAVLMDLIYGGSVEGAELSPLGGMLYAYEFDSPCFQSVRTRRAILAREIDDVAAMRRGARVLSVASGHVREVEWSRAVRDGTASVIAFDQDRESLEFIARHYVRYPVTAVHGTIGELLRRAIRFKGLDLAYAAGLYDYLEDDVAQALTTTLFRSLAPGGRLLIANFTPATRDAAFMEAIMDWHLVYRTPEALRRLASGIGSASVAAIEQFSDPNGHIAYLRLVKQ